MQGRRAVKRRLPVGIHGSLVLAGSLACLAAADTKVFRLRHQPAAAVCTQLLKELGADGAEMTEVGVDGLTNSLTVTGSGELLRQAAEAIVRLDVPATSIVVELLMVEFPADSPVVSRLPSQVRGGAGAVAGAGPVSAPGVVVGAGRAELWEQVTSGAVEAKVLSAPKVAVSDGEEACVNIGSQVHWMEPAGPGLYRLKTLEGSGTRFRVTPTIRGDGIHLSLKFQVQEVRAREPFPEAPDLAVGIPAMFSSNMTTTVTVPDGGTVLSGGWAAGGAGGGEGMVLLRVSTVAPGDVGRMRLEFRLAAREPGEGLTPMAVAGGDGTVYPHERVELSTDDVASARLTQDGGGRPSVEVTFTQEGAKRFAELTRKNVGRSLAIMVDGQVISAPTIRSEIRGGRALITGSFTLEEAKRIAEGLSVSESGLR